MTPSSRRRGYPYLIGLMFVLAFMLGACGPLWDAMPWAVTP